MQAAKTILLLAYTLPPAPGIGARRWSKLCKYLVKEGYTLHILTANYDGRYASSPWEKDIHHPQIHTHRIKGGINPNWLFGNKAPKICRVKERLLYSFHRKFDNWLDQAEGWGPALMSKAQFLLNQEKIKTVIVTGPPHSLCYFGALLKLENSHIKLILDMRDPWNEDPYDYTYPKYLSSIDKKNKALYCQEVAFKFADHIVSIGQTLTEIFIENWGVEKKITTIFNGYDPEDKITSPVAKSSKLKIIYTGMASGNGRMLAVELLTAAVKELVAEEASRGESFWLEQAEFNFVGDSRLAFTERNFKSLPYLASAELSKEIASSHVGFTINSPEYHYLFGSKIYDYMLHGLSTFLISPPGEMSTMIKEKKLGYAAGYDKEEIKEKLRKIKVDFINKQLMTPQTEVVEEYSFAHLAKKYTQVIEDGF